MYKATMRSAWAEINLINLEYNLKQIAARVGSDKQIIAVIKADAYGHGALKVAKTLRNNGIDCFAVTSLEEAISLREAGIEEDIVMFCLVPDICADMIVRYRLSPMVSRYETALALSNEAAHKNTTISGFVSVDTGMGRIGLLADEKSSIKEFLKISELPNFKIKGLFSHFACADCENKTYSKEQENKFRKFAESLENAGVNIPIKTLANSAAIMDIPSAHFDAVRPGIVLYGCYPSKEVKKENLSIKPVMSIIARIAHLKQVPSGSSISYGRAFITERPSTIATITLGYADGLPRRYSNSGKVIIHGKYAPLAGNICMDQCMVDVTDVPGAEIGDEVIIMGNDGSKSVTADDIADASGILNYEVLCGFRQRLPKVYIT